MARPTKYKPEYVQQAEKLCRTMGATDAQLAEFFEVEEKTINNWKEEYPEFLQSINNGKAIHDDATVEKSLLHRANGYSHKAVKVFLTKDGDTVEHEYIEHYPPDPTSMIFWLKNRQPKKWRDKQDIEHSGGIEFTDVVDRPKETAEEWQKRVALQMAERALEKPKSE